MAKTGCHPEPRIRPTAVTDRPPPWSAVTFPRGGEGLSAENYEAQASALSVKSAAGEFSPSQEAMNPKVSEPPAGTVRL